MGPKKILAIKLRALGDSVLTTAPLNELIRAYPQSEIHFLVPQAWSELFVGYPGIHKIWTYERKISKMARARSVTRLAYSLRQENYDCVVNFHASPSSSLIAYATGAKLRAIHFHGHHHRDRHSTVAILGKGTLKPIIERDMDTLRSMGLHIPAGKQPHFPLQPGDLQRAQETLQRLPLTRPLLGMSLSASRPTKQWPVERFASLAIDWCKQSGGSAIAFTGPAEEEIEKKFLDSLDDILSASLPQIQNRAEIRSRIVTLPNLPLKNLAGVLKQLSVWVGSDCGPKHLAIAVDTPTVTLFGPEHPFEWHPYPLDRNPYIFHDELHCRKDADSGMPPWCGLSVCKIEEHKCMKSIGVNSVLDLCRKIAYP